MKNKKVGGVVIMHPNHNNYGTALQGLATTIIFSKMGYTLRIIRYNKRRSLFELIKLLPNLIKTGVLTSLRENLKKKLKMKFNIHYASCIAKRTRKCNEFKAKYFEPLCDYYTGWNNLCQGSKNYDVIFVGSDQVWSPMSLYSGFYNLMFVDSTVPQFSYSSSFGRSTIMPHQIEGVRTFLNKMDAISVRESSGAKIVKDLTGRYAEIVADPTLLLSSNDWKDLIANSNCKVDEPYILCYMLGPRQDNRDSVRDISKALGLKVVTFNHMDCFIDVDEGFGDINNYDCDCLDFLKLLLNAEYVLTDSFHCSVFSILFHKKFLTYYRIIPEDAKSTHSRIDNLLKMTSLDYRIAVNPKNKNNLLKALTEVSDWNMVDKKIEELRISSLKFLKESLQLHK
jgi:hypothetical protein